MRNVPASGLGRNTLAPEIATVLPEYLRTMRRWTVWKWIPPKRQDAKAGKFPLSVTNDSKTWLSFDEALAASAQHAGVGFQMLGSTSVCGIDLDGCIDLDTGAFNEFAKALLAALPETYAEKSPSGKGVRIFCMVPEGSEPPPEFNASKDHGVECYVGRGGRFLTVTGNVLEPGRAGRISPITPAAVRLLTTVSGGAGNAVEIEIALPVPGAERVSEWQKIFDDRLEYKKLKPPHRDYLERGDIPGGRSERTFAIACKMIEARYHPEEVFTVLVSAPGSWEAALDKRDQDAARARALVWSDIGRAQKLVRAGLNEAKQHADTWLELGLKTEFRAKALSVVVSQMNAMRILAAHTDWRGRVALDVTTGTVLLDETPLDDNRFFEMQEKVCTFAGWQQAGNRQWWSDTVRAVATKNPINPREAFLRSLRWDGVSRLDSWFTEYVAAPENDEEDALNRVLGKKWMLSLVARWMHPGVKCDTVLVLQGVEGAGKNTLFEILAGATTRVADLDGFERDDKMMIAQSWIAEMPEAGLFRKAERARLKAFITKPVLQFRPPYASAVIDVQRAFVIVSTANPGQLFQADQDGLRRFWPVQVRDEIDYRWVAEHREQLFAEAVAYLDTADILGDTTPWWFERTPAVLKNRVLGVLEGSSIEDAIVELIALRAGQGGLTLNQIAVELGPILGFRPNDRAIAPFLTKHDFRYRRSAHARVWLHPSWARPGVAGEADVVPLKSVRPAGVEKDEAVA